MLLHEIITFAASERPDAPALITGGRRVSFAQLEERIAALRDLLATRVGAADRVAILADNALDVITASYAVPSVAAVATFANTRHVPEEIDRLFAATRPAVVIATPSMLDRHGVVVAAHVPEADVWSIDGAHPGAGVDLGAYLDRPGVAVAASAARAACVTSPDERDTAWLIHTSGSTGRPKGALLSHRSLSAAVLNTAIARPMRSDDVYLFPFPLFHVAAYNVLHAHLRRRPVVLLERFDAAEVLRLIPAEGVTTCSLAPTMLAMLLDHPARVGAELASLRQISYGAAAMPLGLLRRVQRELPDCGLAQGYGMTELSGNAVFLDPEDHRRALLDAPHLLAAAGRPGPLVSVRVVDDDGRRLPVGASGEIEVRGDQVCAGYLDDATAGARAMHDGWLRTGDIGRFDDEGYLYIVDRKKDLIITGGENVSSREVEDLLGTHPAVRMVAVVGEADERWGERVCAAVVREPGHDLDAEQLIEWTRGRVAGFKRPRRVEFVDALPLNASGKVDKPAVRELLTEAVRSSARGEVPDRLT